MLLPFCLALAVLASSPALVRACIRGRVISRVSRPEVGEATRHCLAFYTADQAQPPKCTIAYVTDAFAEGRDVHSTWGGSGSLSWDEQALKATKIGCALMQSAETGREVAVG